ncbi:heat shock factor protein isoform X2 [Rhipicephalus microplus]|uniref:heat shock factor protein isoform X2 n=1 Tax=Rhipicephalus microplus TaxID=6941 RepID=UPI001886E959|nr:heat shock factor protein-like isoform X2 [Rhipicephalus microplus]
MRTTEIGISNVPAFLIKLWKLVEDEKCNDVISWSSTGRSFIIHNQIQFAKDLLPMYFKHSNMASFIRQLNMYGFRKVANMDQGLRTEREDIEFFHDFFVRGQECLLGLIKRKVPSSRPHCAEDGQADAEVLKKLLTNAGNMHERQEKMDRLLANMKKENESLWREVVRLREKHNKQQQIVEKLIQFLITMVQANRNMTVKRKIPLMLHDSPTSSSKRCRLTKSAFITDYQPGSSQYSEGPVIHDVTDLMEELGDTDSIIVPELMSSAPMAALVSAPSMPELPSASSVTCSELDTIPVVSSPLSSDDVIEPLCLLEPLQDPQSSDIEEVVDSAVPSPQDPHVTSSKGMQELVLKASQAVTPAASNIKLVTSPISDFSSHLIVEEDATLLGDKQSTNGTSNVLNSCATLEDLPNFAGSVPATISTSTPATSGTELTTEKSPTRKEDATDTPSSQVMQVALQDKNSGTTKIFADHVESIDYDLDWLQDQLSGGGLNLDTSTLMGLFSPEETLTSRLGDLATESRSSDITGNELVKYTPSVLDLGIEECSSFQPENEILLSDDELPISSAAFNAANSKSSAPRSSPLGTCEQSDSSQSASPSSLFQQNFKSVLPTKSRPAGKRGTSSGRKRRGGSKK